MQVSLDGSLLISRMDGINQIQARRTQVPGVSSELYLPLEELRSSSGQRLNNFHRGPSGRYWASGSEGVFQRVGKEFRAISGPVVSSATILESKSGRLWAYGAEGLFWIEPNLAGMGRWIAVELPGQVRPDPIRGIYEDRAGNIWLGRLGGWARLSLENVGFRAEMLNLESYLRQSDCVQMITQTNDGDIWMASNWGILPRVDRPVFLNVDERDGLAEAASSVVLHDAKGTLWLGTRARGIYRRNADVLQLLPGSQKGVLLAMVLAEKNGFFSRLHGDFGGVNCSSSQLLATGRRNAMNQYRAFSPNYGTHIY